MTMNSSASAMRAIVLAAGRGERMGELTRDLPKPLLTVGGETLIDHTVRRLAAAGIRDLVVNLAYRGDQIRAHLEDGARHGVSIRYSLEPDGALETGGGIAAALPLLGNGPFVAVNADVWTDFDFSALQPPQGVAHLVLVPNPDHHPNGDFAIDSGLINEIGDQKHTFSGIGVYRPALFAGVAAARFPLAPLLRNAARRGEVSGELFRGQWVDVGTPARLAAVQNFVAAQRRH